jgi:hypothetical protein
VRIEALRRERKGEWSRISAGVTWEDCDREPCRVFFETQDPYAEDLRLAPGPFLTAALSPAFRAQERRIAVEGSVCPLLRDGLTTAMQILASWYDPARRIATIEPSEGFRPAVTPAAPRTGMFLSGGIDSLALLRRNRLDLPPTHPAAVRDALFVYGLDIGVPAHGERLGFYERARASLASAAAEAGVELIPVRTNLRELACGGSAWPEEWYGLALAGVGHAFEGRLSHALIASGLDVWTLVPNGSHPMLDPYFSSAGVRFLHQDIHLSRLERIRIVADWPTGLRAVRVCWQDVGDDGPLNCGRCRKCLATMMGLLTLGRLADSPSFPVHEITPGMLDVIEVDRLVRGFHDELLEPLERIGRADLAEALRARIEAYEQSLRGPWRRRAHAVRRWLRLGPSRRISGREGRGSRARQ